MKQPSPRRQATLALVLSGFLACVAPASGADIALPGETVRLRPSPLAGFEIASQKCGTCHSADYIAYQPPGMTQTQWTAEVNKMRATYGAQLGPDDIRSVGIYLTAAYGDVGSLAAADLAPSASTSTPEGAAAAPTQAQSSSKLPDVQALLSKNACLGCHALQQKIVGPAYRDVAAKYRGDPAAQSKIATSIREGGSGRWGTVPMPAFQALSDAELKALAEFVLGQ
jgi:cytochrome c551/c552